MPIMDAPESGVKVRMYRQGHGDCFLLAFRDDDGNPFYMLIDCGYLPGSEIHQKFDKILTDIAESTGNHIHVVLITHEHQDHVNGFWSQSGRSVKEHFKHIEIDRLWVAWTENPDDEDANNLRRAHHDTLLGLMAAGELLAAAPDERDRAVSRRIQDLLEFEIEGDQDEFRALTIAGITNKRAIKYIQDKTRKTPLYLEPHGPSNWLPNVSGVNVYALGPPRDEELLLSLEPEETGGRDEGYSRRFSLGQEDWSFLAALPNRPSDEEASAIEKANQPFEHRNRIPEKKAYEEPFGEFFSKFYSATRDIDPQAWRRIDHEWLRTSEVFALRLNNGVNNTCLVIAIELPNTKKVLLFPGDAQRGNWISWNRGTWRKPDGKEVTAEDLLGRTVFYKVGHHGSHNATLKGYLSSDYPNLNWMARGEYKDEFVAMIPANTPWAKEKKGWTHPLPSIQEAIKRKAKGRVFRSDIDRVSQKEGITDVEWSVFQNHTTEEELYFEYKILDEF